MEDWGLIIVLTWLTIFGLTIHSLLQKKRTAKLRVLADRLGCDFAQHGELSLIPNYQDFSLVTKDPHYEDEREISNVISGIAGRGNPVIFDYKYQTGVGTRYINRRQTVACLKLKADLPDFEIHPAGGNRSSWFMLDYIKPELQHDLFDSENYIFAGDNNSGQLTPLATTPLKDYLEENPGLSIEVRDSVMLVYFNVRHLTAKEIPDFIKQVENIHSLFSFDKVANDEPGVRPRLVPFQRELIITGAFVTIFAFAFGILNIS